MSESLDQTVLLLGNPSVEYAHLAVVPACKDSVWVEGMKVDCSNVIVVLRVLPLS
jgi:hypothetical protein